MAANRRSVALLRRCASAQQASHLVDISLNPGGVHVTADDLPR
jgi:hypothetical protein